MLTSKLFTVVSRRALVVATPVIGYRTFSDGSPRTPEPPSVASLETLNQLKPFRFLTESVMIADPEKIRKNITCEDALISTPHLFGVSDGVGGWRSSGVDSGIYARNLMSATEAAAESMITNYGLHPDPFYSIVTGHPKVSDQGSTTVALIASGSYGKARVYCYGDSQIQVWRYKKPTTDTRQLYSLEEAGKLWERVFSTEPERSQFNTPDQVGAYDSSARLALGLYQEVPVESGDVVLAMTDGITDNLFDYEIRNILAKFDTKSFFNLAKMKKARYEEALKVEKEMNGYTEKKVIPKLNLLGLQQESYTDNQILNEEKNVAAMAKSISNQLVAEARRRALGDQPTPFSKECDAHFGPGSHVNGKPDDTTVVTGIVLPDDLIFQSFNPPFDSDFEHLKNQIDFLKSEISSQKRRK